MLNIGFSEAVVIFVVALIVLGPERLPELGKYLARLSIEVKKSIDEIKKELELEEVEKELKEAKEEIEKLKDETLGLVEKSVESPPINPSKDLTENQEPVKDGTSKSS